MIGHKNLIRVSTNEENPSRELQGFTTTYAAVAMQNDAIVSEFTRRRYILVLDEPHHISDKGSYKRSILPLVERASLCVFMSGTLERGSKDKIAFLDYAEGTETDEISVRETEETKHISYTRVDALEEQAVIPLRVTYLDARSEWKKDQTLVQCETLQEEDKSKRRQALFTALSTQFAEQLIDKAVADWRKTKAKNPRSKILLVAGTQLLARKYGDYMLQKHGVECGVATVDEGAAALKTIRKYKRVVNKGFTPLDAISTVGMAYEGLDVKPITHICCLTRIRSKPWIEQMLARATRFDSEAGSWQSQDAHVFAPDDPDIHSVIDAIVREQKTAAAKKAGTPSSGGDLGPTNFVQPSLFGGVIPMNSGALSSRSLQIDKRADAPPDTSEVLLTPSQIEADMRESIDYKVKTHCSNSGKSPIEINALIKKKFGKGRDEMTVDELKILRRWSENNL